jgi:hypothetical protein
MLAAEALARPVRRPNAPCQLWGRVVGYPITTAPCAGGNGSDKGAEKWYSQQ